MGTTETPGGSRKFYLFIFFHGASEETVPPAGAFPGDAEAAHQHDTNFLCDVIVRRPEGSRRGSPGPEG